MSPEARLHDLTEQLEAAKKVAAEKRKHYRAARPLASQPGGYKAYLVAAAGYASAADSLEELIDSWEEAQQEAFAEQVRRERERQPEFGITA